MKSYDVAVVCAGTQGHATFTYTPGYPKAMNGFLGLPDDLETVAVLPIGCPADGIRTTVRDVPGPRVPLDRYGKRLDKKE